MLGSPARLGPIALALVLAATLRAQDGAPWIADLGDPHLGEAAERALLQLGDRACPQLERLFAAWPVGNARDVERLRGALRVVDLLGEPAAPLAATLSKQLATTPPQLRIATFTALGSLAPYADIDPKQVPFDELMNGVALADEAQLVAAIVRLTNRAAPRARDLATALMLPHSGTLFVREIAAEMLERRGNEVTVDTLRFQLLDRRLRAAGWDQVRYNGVVVPIEDGFRLRAATVLVRLASDDPRCIVGHGCLALLHPHRATRRESLQALTRFAPGIGDALPELLQVAQQGDAEFATEALKLLVLLERAVGPHLAEIQVLQARADGSVARLAANLATRLQTMGFVAPPVAPAARAPLPGATHGLAEEVAACLQANPHQNLAYHVETFYRAGRALPDDIARRIAELGRSRPKEERESLRRLLASFGEGWFAKCLSRSVGGGDLPVAHARAYGVLVVGEPEALQELAVYLDHDNVAVRLAAARQLAARHESLPAQPGADASPAEERMQRLLLAARADAPASSRFQSVNGWFTMRLDLQAELQAAAAAALVDYPLPPEQHPGLLRRVLRHDDGPLVALAVARWGAATPVEELTPIASDPRPAVAQAATAALARRAVPK